MIEHQPAPGMAPPEPPPSAEACFATRLPLARRYVALLADSGSTQGLIGPREVPRLWDRHVLNCAVLSELIPDGSVVIDVGSGAGLPGIALAIARPDVAVTLVEPLLRRTRWLEAAVADLGLTNVAVRRGRAEAFAGELSASIVTARAVSGLADLGRWSAPLLALHGVLLAVKGDSAALELQRDEGALRQAGFGAAEVCRVGGEIVSPPTTVVRARLERQRRPAPAAKRSAPSTRAQSGSRAGRRRV